MAGVDEFHFSRCGVNGNRDHRHKRFIRQRMAEIVVEIGHQLAQSKATQNTGVNHRVKTRRDQRRRESFATDIGHRKQRSTVGHSHRVDIVAAHPFARDESDREIQTGELGFPGNQSHLNLPGALQFALHDGNFLRLSPRRPG